MRSSRRRLSFGTQPTKGATMAASADTPVLDLLSSMTAESVVVSGLDPQSLMVARIAALVATDAPAISYVLNLEAAVEAGIDATQVQGVLTAVAPIVGTVRVASALGKIADALEIELEIAELQAQSEE
ncbi:hypothetical protein OM076_43245 [Solirubrobacter ginsenosidimutans]|uniref:Carboxymuconolactone decarboxylase n=1 Tax=Solirubrobacter ginsenosidimutans TaxID=490573 RepID=A0A9X3N4M3_9ACTN|nr:hypothetical protein [Solirubrobacter ginsenosidimutans]MDA0167156.1 hypothetical protein [Solirubrobacter ginsenosidimutans]